MKTVAITAFKAQCLAMLEDVARTGEPLMVTKRGKPLTRVVAAGDSGEAHPQRGLAGTVTITSDVVEPVLPPTAWNAVRGELLPTQEDVATERRRPRRRLRRE